MTRTPALSLLLLWTVSTAVLATDIRKACSNFCGFLQYKADEEIANCVLYCESLIAARLNQQADAENDGVGEMNVEDGMLYVPEVDNNYEKRRQSSFVRIGRSGSPPQRRVSSFVRIGRAKPSSFVRIGKAKPSSFVRIGKAKPSSFVRIGKKDDTENLEDNQGIGQAIEEQENKRASNFVRIGKSPSSFVRIGKSPVYNEQMARSLEHFLRQAKSRGSAFIRIGKKSDQEQEVLTPEEEKRASSFVRIGKASSFVRIGKSDPEMVEEKPPSILLGEGDVQSLPYEDKRASSFVRIGKSSDVAEPIDEESKRASSFVRIGKSGQYPHYKRISSFVRIGKKSDDDGTLGAEKRRASSFVRIGKSMPSDETVDDSMDHLAEYVKASETEPKRASSFVRIGKRDAEEFQT